MTVIHIPLKRELDESYNIQIGENMFSVVLADIRKGIFPKAHRLVIITDDNVRSLYAEDLYKRLTCEGLNVLLLSFPAGEASKTRETKAWLEDQMIANHCGRDSAIIALGGGVVSDLAGFVAGTFARGIPFINYSTTLLSAADASIGGKTAVDTPAATNLIGLFYQPKKVYIDIATWQTLPEAEIRNGLAETVKHACLADAAFFSYLEANCLRLLKSRNAEGRLDLEVAHYVARKNCEIKQQIVARDVQEENERQLLNLGHTLGRALEPLAGYRLAHGEAVAIGLVFQLRLGLRFGYVSQEDLERVRALLENIGLPVWIPPEISPEAILSKMFTDKKVRRDKIRFVFQKGLGDAMRFEDGAVSRPVSEKEIAEVLSQSYCPA